MQAFGLHAHEEEGAGHESHEEDNGFVWKALVVLVTIYGFFLFETLMHLCLKSKIGEHSHSHVDVEVGKFNTLDTACAKYFAYSSVIYFNGKMRSVLALLSLFFVFSLKSRVFCYPRMIILPENFFSTETKCYYPIFAASWSFQSAYEFQKGEKMFQVGAP